MRRTASWYSVSEETLRALLGLAVGTAILVGGYRSYLAWDQYTIERRATETLNGARSLLDTLSGGDTFTGHRKEISQASLNLREAEQAWEQGSYRSALSKAQVSRGLLLDVLDSVQNPGRRGEARFIYVEGEVEYRRGETGRFRRARPRDVLHEGDYVRSSDQGSAEILFDGDGTLFTVRPGTMLKIQARLRLRGRGEPVRMEYGWVDLETSRRPSGVETEHARIRLETDSEATVTYEQATASARFAVGRGTAQVAAIESGHVRQLEQLEQVLARAEALGRTTGLLDQPRVIGPPNGFDLMLDRTREVVLSWNPVPGATAYQLQVSRSRLFGEAVIDRRRTSTKATLGVNSEGNFYWRVAAYGGDGVLGPWSSLRKFRALSMGGIGWKDTVPPEIELAKVTVNGNIVIVTGRTEPGVRLEVDGQRAPVAADGSFTMSVTPASEGLVDVVVSAVDASGNRSEARRQVFIETL
ncbi:MAG TPA: Ig-like domain-containing protein [Thermoanaerobaculia bacterium]|nr:Ig-like domain-containing protein [Thermoanaerobaculia bacterium]